MGGDPSRPPAAEPAGTGLDLRRYVVQLGVGEHRFVQFGYRRDRGWTRPMEEPETNLETTDLIDEPARQSDGCFGAVDIERHDYATPGYRHG